MFAGTPGTVTLVNSVSADSITFDTNGYIITGSDTLTLNNSTNTVINVPPTGSSPIYIDCVIGGSGYFLTGGGVLVLENAGNYCGSSTSAEYVNGPNTTLVVLTDHDTGNDGVTLNLQNGGIYQDNDTTAGDQFLLPGCAIALLSGGGVFDNPNASLTMSNYITGSGSLSFTGVSGYTLTLTDTGNNYSGGTIVSGPGTLKASAAGTLGSTSAPLTVNGGILDLSAASQTAGTVTITGGTIQDGTLTGSSYTGEGGTVSAVLAGSGTWTQTSGTNTLSGANTYTGITTINNGLMQITNDNNLGAAPSSPVANRLTLNNTSTGNYGLRAQSDSFSLGANRGITLEATGGSIQVQSGQTLTVPGVITGSGSLLCGTAPTIGEGTLILSGANTYTGATSIAAGTLQLGASGSLPSTTALTVASAAVGGIFNLNNYNQTIGSLASSAGINGAGTTTPTVELGSGTLTVNGTSSTTFAGVISGSGSLVKTGSATLTLNGKNTYTGNTAISAGALALGSTGSINNSAMISIAAGATFDVSAIASYALSSSTTLSASGTSPAATIKGGTTVSLGSQPIILAYDGSHPALTISQGSLSLNGNAFTVNGSPLAAGAYTIVQQTSGSIAGSGSYSVSGTAIPATGATAAISVSGGNVILTITDTTTTTLHSLSPSTYGQSVTFTATVAPAPGGGMVQFYDNGVALGSAVTVSGGSASYTTNTLSAGSHPITAGFSGTTGYAASSTASASTQQVNQATLSITASAQSKTYGQTVVFGSGSTNFSSSGLVNGDTIGTVTLAVSGNGGAATAAVSGSPYTITPSTATGGTFNAANYTITYNPGALTVYPASLTVAVNNSSQPYGAANPAFSVTYSNFVNGETLGTSDVAGSPALSTGADTNSPVGAYVITNSLGTLTSTNYSFNLVNGILAVTNALSSNVVSSSENPALPGDSVAFTATLSALAPSLAVPGGTVQFQIDGSAFGGPVTLSNGVAVSSSTASLSHGYHTNEADYAGNTNILGSTNTLIQLINTPPVAGLASYSRAPNQGLTIAISNLLSNASDADGDALVLAAVSATSTNGAAITTNASDVFYSPPATNGNVPDAFSYTVADPYGATSSNLVIVNIQSVSNGPPPVNITGITLLGDGTVQLNFMGTPGGVYLIEAATNLSQPIVWTTVGTNTADTNGVFSFTDINATNFGDRYYRTAIQQ